MMGLFSAMVKIVLDVMTFPVAVVKDIVTLGGISSGQPKSYTAQKLDQICEDAEEADD